MILSLADIRTMVRVALAVQALPYAMKISNRTLHCARWLHFGDWTVARRMAS